MVLQVVGLYLGMQPYPATFLPQIYDASPSDILDLPHRGSQLGTAIASQAAEGVPSQAFGMHPHEDGVRPAHVTQCECHVIQTRAGLVEHPDAEVAVRGRKPRFSWDVHELVDAVSIGHVSSEERPPLNNIPAAYRFRMRNRYSPASSLTPSSTSPMRSHSAGMS